MRADRETDRQTCKMIAIFYILTGRFAGREGVPRPVEKN